jgi:hypothetical protein
MDGNMNDKNLKRVVFVCIENANRSQMAEAFARMHGNAKPKEMTPEQFREARNLIEEKVKDL